MCMQQLLHSLLCIAVAACPRGGPAGYAGCQGMCILRRILVACCHATASQQHLHCAFHSATHARAGRDIACLAPVIALFFSAQGILMGLAKGCVAVRFQSPIVRLIS
jgi:hypothetical protein